jgi:hypothetical protein
MGNIFCTSTSILAAISKAIIQYCLSAALIRILKQGRGKGKKEKTKDKGKREEIKKGKEKQERRKEGWRQRKIN